MLQHVPHLAGAVAIVYRESGHRHLMQALAVRGNTAEAVRAYEQLRTLLREEFGIAPSAQTLQLHAQLLTERAPAPTDP